MHNTATKCDSTFTKQTQMEFSIQIQIVTKTKQDFQKLDMIHSYKSNQNINTTRSLLTRASHSIKQIRPVVNKLPQNQNLVLCEAKQNYTKQGTDNACAFS